MIINKTQCQILTHCGVDLEDTSFSHGQLYKAFSRFERPDLIYTFMH